MNRKASTTAPGISIARLLKQAWRQSPELSSTTAAEVESIVPLLLKGGAAALAWRQLILNRHETHSLLELRNAYRRHSIEAMVHETNVRDIFRRARAAGLDPIIFKGWALARLYPEDGLRPYGDVDLWIEARDIDKFYDVLSARAGDSYCVEAHTSFYESYERSFADVFSRSRLVPLGDVNVRVPCDEDHLRFICLHFLYHGGWRPLWLCDIGLMLEAAGTEFDWDRCLRGTRKHAEWIACIIGLAHQLLDADVSQTPSDQRGKNLPGWLVPAVLKQWGLGVGMSHAEPLSFSLRRGLFKPAALVNALREHWRNPLQASVEAGAWFDDRPRSPVQIRAAISNLPGFPRALI